ncbi:galactose oxidase [Tripterygium wilfordii]|uniref:Aldehyde oxidase GLOX n=1 Tax=Tripterygium wilfordii TaxID=458696 RepID=A0A7J7D393_TRIWF|nr:aldehyde oxidase GLOX-like [Tripterygium wilfordii]KAF5740824.1 galactose oxidase [Tripterygium wilfordii]
MRHCILTKTRQDTIFQILYFTSYDLSTVFPAIEDSHQSSTQSSRAFINARDNLDDRTKSTTQFIHSSMSPTLITLSTLFLLVLTQPCLHRSILAEAAGGRFQLLQRSIGIAAMHMQLLNNDRVIIFDRTDFGQSNISLPAGKCRTDPNETALKTDCTAHSVEYNVLSNEFRPLMVQTDVWCSSGAVTPDGRLIQTGGFNDGDRKVRIMSACDGGCDWVEVGNGLAARRWYATNHILPDGKQIIIGGRREYNYEFYPKNGAGSNTYSLPFLVQTNDPGIENNLYPFVYLNVDGFLFIFANNRAILFDYSKNKVVRTYPAIPGGDPRCYPSTGSSVLLPLKNLGGPGGVEAEVLVCGGAPKGSFTAAGKGNFVGALNTCARIKITDPNPQWVMETMPLARVMGDMTLLPNGHVLIINGAAAGSAGWELGRKPVLSPVLYRPGKKLGSRFETQNPSTIPRMYHSTAILLRDGRVLVGGSNPHVGYEFSGVLYPTELSLEAFNPSYLDVNFVGVRPRIVSPATQAKLKYKQILTVRFSVTGTVVPDSVSVTMVAPSFTTHSFSMNQRLLVLDSEKATSLGKSVYEIRVTTPGSGILAPAGYYMLFVVHQEIPSAGIWVHLQ